MLQEYLKKAKVQYVITDLNYGITSSEFPTNIEWITVPSIISEKEFPYAIHGRRRVDRGYRICIYFFVNSFAISGYRCLLCQSQKYKWVPPFPKIWNCMHLNSFLPGISYSNFGQFFHKDKIFTIVVPIATEVNNGDK